MISMECVTSCPNAVAQDLSVCMSSLTDHLVADGQQYLITYLISVNNLAALSTSYAQHSKQDFEGVVCNNFSCCILFCVFIHVSKCSNILPCLTSRGGNRGKWKIGWFWGGRSSVVEHRWLKSGALESIPGYWWLVIHLPQFHLIPWRIYSGWPRVSVMCGDT